MDYEDEGSYELRLALRELEDIDPVIPTYMWDYWPTVWHHPALYSWELVRAVRDERGDA